MAAAKRTSKKKTSTKTRSKAMRRCKRCHKTKPKSEFSSTPHSKDGLMRVCTKCFGGAISRARQEGRSFRTQAETVDLANQALDKANKTRRSTSITKAVRDLVRSHTTEVKKLIRGLRGEGIEVEQFGLEGDELVITYRATERFKL
jgi:hypothetical protein